MSKAVTQNSCSYCTPLGASLAFKGIENTITMLHGSQGCATYMRRFLISHFREPIDIASSSFTEETAIFGGGQNLHLGLDNLSSQYEPELIAVASTCLSETIGDDLNMHISEYKKKKAGQPIPEIIAVSTPSYKGSHIEGFYIAVTELVKHFSEGKSSPTGPVNLFPGMVSCEDLRYLKSVLHAFNVPYIMVPDYSETLEGGNWKNHHPIPPGGTPVRALARTGIARGSIEFGQVIDKKQSAATYLAEKRGVPAAMIPIPIGIHCSDIFFKTLEEISGTSLPTEFRQTRGRLVDAYGDAHKYVFGKRAIIYGEDDFVLSIASFLLEIGMQLAVCGGSGRGVGFKDKLVDLVQANDGEMPIIYEGSDFKEVELAAMQKGGDIFVGNSKGYKISRSFDIPLVRIGFPIHDRVGGQRIHHLGYKGTLYLLDLITNEIIRTKQSLSSVAYSYI
ncbi:MAG: nitrogenase [Deltaproteobacteria bacterium]|nr:nitrogenase [Deltaproteobacteria bacterium]MBN2671353.1 nitrogenase [Deltaproteobacteria bacterium]